MDRTQELNRISFVDDILNKLAKSIAPYVFAHKAFMVLGFIGFPAYYFIWHYYMPQPYESFTLRVIGSGLCLLLFLKDQWPKIYKKYYPLVFYVVCTYSLPFFFTYFLFKNNATTISLMTMICGIYISVLILNWISFFLTYLIGISLAWIFYIFTASQLSSPHLFLKYWPIYIFAIVTSMLTKYIIMGLVSDKIAAIKSSLRVCYYAAHELRTPLLAIKAANKALNNTLPTLINAYRLSRMQGLGVKDLGNDQLMYLNDVVSRVDAQIDHANQLINNLLLNTENSHLLNKAYEAVSINSCIQQALFLYPFRSASDRNKIFHDTNNDFTIYAPKELVIHVIHNLMTNAFDAISHTEKGVIQIWTQLRQNNNELHFKDNGNGISNEDLPFIFNPYFSTKESGSGIGLPFIKNIMKQINGDIFCHSEPGTYTEFVLNFARKDLT